MSGPLTAQLDYPFFISGSYLSSNLPLASTVPFGTSVSTFDIGIQYSNGITWQSTPPTFPLSAAGLTYTPPFTGAVTESVSAKLAQTVSVLDFGAVGNGVANDTPAFVAATATGNPIFVPFTASFYAVTALTSGQIALLYGPGVVKIASVVQGVSAAAGLFASTPIEIAAGTHIANALYEPYDIRRYGADQTGVLDSSAAMDSTPNIALCYPGTYLNNNPIVAGKPVISVNASFTGSNAVTGFMPAFGANDFVVMEFLGGNAIIGAIANNLGTIALTGVAITGVAGQFSCNAATLAVGTQVIISGTFGGTGSINGYANPTTYVISATNLSTTFTLTAIGGGALTTTAGTPSGLTYSSSPAAGQLNFPTGITGYARVNSLGNQGFGLFGRADIYAAAGVATNEFNSFNWTGSPANSTLPPNRGIGTSQLLPICVTVAAGGNSSNSIGIHIAPEGATNQQFLTGIYTSPNTIINFGYYFDALLNDTNVPVNILHSANKNCVQLAGKGLITGTAITGTAGQFSCAATTLTTGMQVRVQGTLSGSGTITGYSNPTTYQISATNGTTTFTLQAIGGGALTTTAGTTAGISLVATNPLASVLQYLDANAFPQFKFTQNGSISSGINQALPAGGSQSIGITLSSTANFGVYYGNGAPTLSAAQGSLYLRSDGASNVTRMYINNSAGSGNTWTSVNTVA